MMSHSSACGDIKIFLILAEPGFLRNHTQTTLQSYSTKSSIDLQTVLYYSHMTQEYNIVE